MSLLDRFRKTTEAEQTGYEAIPIDAALSDTFTQGPGRDALTVRPHKDNGGIEAMDEVLESLHTVETESPRLRGSERNVSPAHAFEMRYAAPRPEAERVVSLQYVPGADDLLGALERQLQTRYPDSQVSRTDPGFLTAREGQYVAGAALGLRRYTLYPIKNVDLPGFRSDPTGSILQEMVGAQKSDSADADVAVQVMFKPASRDWTQGVPEGHGTVDGDDPNIAGDPSLTDLSYNLRQPSHERHRKVFTWETVEKPPTTVDKNVANLLEDQQGSKGWRLCIRVFAVSDDREVAVTRASKVAGQFRNFYESASEQTFIPQPLAGSTLRSHVADAIGRTFTDTGVVKAQREVAGLVNIPEAQYVNTNKLRWSMATTGDGVPPGTPRYDYDAAGVAGADDAEKQVAMLTEPRAGASDDAFWLGFGYKYGTEAGIPERFLNAHMFVGGRTRYGKTTLLTNFASQLFDRGRGGLVIDPKGKDADEFIAEWPEHRDEEDLIVMDLGDEFERTPQFNFLEVPDSLEPGTRAHASYVEGLADDITAMVAQAGGSDNYLGALMKRVTKTLVRGLTKSGRTATLLDLACCASTQENLGAFRGIMDEERIHFIRETAARLAEKEDTDLEPLAGRMDEWVHNDAIRDLISARDPSFSVQDAVDENKVIVVRFPESAGETEKQMLTTALIRRAYCSKRLSDSDAPYYLVCDEFDKIATPQSNLHTILSEAGAHGFRLCLACQAPASQLPDRLKQAVANQVETYITFDPGEEDAGYVARHHSIEPSELTDLPRYQVFLRQQTIVDGAIDDLTDSYRVRTFPPAREVRAEVDGGAGRSEEDVHELKRRSIERYGERAASPQRQQADSLFFDTDDLEADTPDTDTADEGDAGTVALTDERERRICKAVYDAAVQAGREEEFVPADTAAERIRAYFDAADDPADISHQSRLWDLLDRVPRDLLERETRDGDVYLRTTADGESPIFRTGAAASGGGPTHRALLKDVYDPLTRLGARVTLPTQDGTDLPDAVATLEDVDTLDELPGPDEWADLSLRERARLEDDLRAAFREENATLARLSDAGPIAIEAECSTGESKPAQTWQNLAEALSDGHRCLFAVREDVAPEVWAALTENGPHARRWSGDHERCYNGPDLRIDGDLMLRPAGARETVWLHDTDTGEYHLRDSDGEHLATFPDATAVLGDTERYPTTDASADAESDEWVPVKRPFVPEADFADGVPDREEWDIIIVPDGASEPADLLHYNGDTGERTSITDLHPDAIAENTPRNGGADGESAPADPGGDTAETHPRDDGDSDTDGDPDEDTEKSDGQLFERF